MAATPKVIESHLNEIIVKMTYAALQDIDEASEEGKIDPCAVQTYANLCKDKKERCDGLKSRVVISDPARQFLAAMLAKMVEEANISNLSDGDTPAIIRAKVIEANTESYTDFMFGVAEVIKPRFGRTLSTAADATNWIEGNVALRLHKLSAQRVALATVAAEFSNFIKSLAWLIAQMLQYNPTTISENWFLGLLAQQNMDVLMRDILRSVLRPKAAAKPRAPKKVADDVPAEDGADGADDGNDNL